MTQTDFWINHLTMIVEDFKDLKDDKDTLSEL